MKRTYKIILSAVIFVGVLSMLFAVIPVTKVFVISYSAAVVATLMIAGTLIACGGQTPAVGYAYVYTAITYAVLSTVFSVIACLIPVAVIWTFIIHAALLALFAIRFIALSAGGDYINELDGEAEKKHSEFLEEKKNYWK